VERREADKQIGRDWCRAAFWIDFRGRRYPVLPREVAPLLLVPIALVVIALAVLEWRLGSLAARGEIIGPEWQAEDRLINDFNAIKIRQPSLERRWASEGIRWTEPATSRKRIVVVGDSFAWGSGNLNANDIWWRQLARELQRRGYWNVEVLSLCQAGASTEDQLHWLREEGWLEKSRPDLVIFGYVTNDPAIRRGDGFLVRQVGGDVPLPSWSGLDQTLGRVAPNVAAQVRSRLTRKWESSLVDAYPYSAWELKILEEPNISRYGAVLKDLGSFLRASAIPHAFFTLPNSPTTDVFEPRYSGVRPHFEAAGIPFVDLLPSFVNDFGEGRARLGWGINPANGHPGQVSTRFYARKVADWLESHHPDVLGERSQEPVRLTPRINDWMPPAARVRPAGEGTWTVQIPNAEARAPRLPIKRAFTMLSFENPVAIDTIRIAGNDLEEVELFYTTVDSATGVDGGEPVSAGKRSGHSAAWQLPANALTNTLRLTGSAPGLARDAFATASLTMTFREPAVRP
jgi:hypothetical protein